MGCAYSVRSTAVDTVGVKWNDSLTYVLDRDVVSDVRAPCKDFPVRVNQSLEIPAETLCNHGAYAIITLRTERNYSFSVKTGSVITYILTTRRMYTR